MQNIKKPFDPIHLADSITYTEKGLTVQSNNINVHKRDQAGNIILELNDTTINPLLIIEPVTENITLSTVLPVLNTRFSYFTFPVTVTENASVSNLDIMIDTGSLSINTTDTISTRYTIPKIPDANGVLGTFDRLNTTYNSTWLSNGGVEYAGGFNELPFNETNQLTPYGFTITKEILETLQTTNKTIKFFIQLQGNPATTNATTFKLRLMRKNANPGWRNKDLLQVKTTTKGTGNEFPVLSFEYILNVNDLSEYDIFYVTAVTNNPALYYIDNTIWDIELIDNENINYSNNGVTVISNNTELKLNPTSND